MLTIATKLPIISKVGLFGKFMIFFYFEPTYFLVNVPKIYGKCDKNIWVMLPKYMGNVSDNIWEVCSW